MNALARAFQEAAAAGDAAAVTYDTAELPARLTALYARGRAAHPGLEVAEEAFGGLLARAAAGGPGQGPYPALERLAIEDLYLACACIGGAAGAAAVFEARFSKAIRRGVSRVLAIVQEREEAEQLTRQRLLVGDAGAPAAIRKYLGHGPMESWVSVVAIRVAIGIGRAETSERRLRGKAIAEATGVDPERMVIREEVRRELEAAVKEALARLPDRERLILRLFLVSGMRIEAIGKSLGITRQAVSRSLAKARSGLLDDVNLALKERLKVSSSELVSIIRVVASQIDVSISRLLSPP